MQGREGAQGAQNCPTAGLAWAPTQGQETERERETETETEKGRDERKAMGETRTERM